MVSREIYPNAPLVMVVMEVRYSYLPEFDEEAARSRVLRTIRDKMPILTRRQQVNLEIGPQGAKQNTTPLLEARSKDRRMTAEISSERFGLTIAGSAYTSFEDSMRPLVDRLAAAIETEAQDLYVTRLGLRYVDEIRWPGNAPTTVKGWSKLVDRDRLDPSGALGALELDGVATRASVSVELDAHRQVTTNWGTFFGSSVVGEDHPFAPKGSLAARMFVIDVDTSWNAPEDPEAQHADSLVSLLESLHEPARTMFESLITEEARELFRRKP